MQNAVHNWKPRKYRMYAWRSDVINLNAEPFLSSRTIFKMAECYLHFWLRFRLKYLPSNEQSLNLVIKTWNNKCRPIVKKKVIFPPEFPFKWGQFSYLGHAN